MTVAERLERYLRRRKTGVSVKTLRRHLLASDTAVRKALTALSHNVEVNRHEKEYLYRWRR